MSKEEFGAEAEQFLDREGQIAAIRIAVGTIATSPGMKELDFQRRAALLPDLAGLLVEVQQLTDLLTEPPTTIDVGGREINLAGIRGGRRLVLGVMALEPRARFTHNAVTDLFITPKPESRRVLFGQLLKDLERARQDPESVPESTILDVWQFEGDRPSNQSFWLAWPDEPQDFPDVQSGLATMVEARADRLRMSPA